MSLRLSALLCLIVGLMTAAHAQFEIQRANLHIHTSSSWRGWTIIPFGGLGDHEFCVNPLDTVAWADIHGLDVVGFSDHAESLVPWEWNELGQVANNYGGLTALRGFEWTGSDHVNVFGTESWCGNGAFTGLFPIENGAPPNPNITTVSSLMAWLQTAPMSPGYGPTPVAQFNHAYLYNHFGGFPYDPVADRYFRLIELGSVDAEEPLTGELYHPIIESQAEYHQALATGWHVAPSIGADNQLPPKWADRNRHTAIYTPVGGGREGVMQGLRARRVFASESQDFQLDYRCRVEGQTGFPHWMGEQVFLPNGKSTTLWIVAQDLVEIDYVDVMTPFGQVRRYGSINDTYFATTLTLTPAQLRSYGVTANDEACVYLRIHFENGNDAISAPIWFKDRTYVSGRQPEDWVWTEDRSPYIINGTFTILAGRTLTIEPGVVVKFEQSNSYEWKGRIDLQGTLRAIGAEGSPVTFTSTNDNSVGGTTGTGTPQVYDWLGIQPYGSGLVELEHCVLRYGSSLVSGSNVSITTRSTLFENCYDGVQGNSLSLSVTGCTFRHCSAGINIGSTAGPVIDNNVFDGNGYGIAMGSCTGVGFDGNLFRNQIVYAASLSNCSGDLTFEGPTGSGNAKGLYLAQCTTTADTAFKTASGFPHIIIGYSLTIPAGVTLTVEPGVVVKFENHVYSEYQGRIEVAGTLRATGTASSPAIFTSIDDHSAGGNTGTGTPQVGSWRSIYPVALDGAVIELTHCRVSYAQQGVSANVHRTSGNWYSATVVLQSSTFRDCGTGVELDNYYGSATTAQITGSTFENCYVGLRLTRINAPIVNQNVFEANRYGLEMAQCAGVGFNGNVFQNQREYAAVLSGCTGDLTFQGSAGSGNARGLYLSNCTPTVNTTFRTASGFPHIIIGYSLTIPAGVTLTVEPGVVVKFENHVYSEYQGRIEVAGTLRATGTASSPAIFTSIDDHSAGGNTGTGTPQVGSWRSIYPVALDGAAIELSHCRVSYAQQGVSANYHRTGGNWYSAAVVLQSSTFRDCWTGVMDNYSQSATTAQITGSTFENCSVGLRLTRINAPIVDNNVFEGNSYGIVMAQCTAVKVRSCTFAHDDIALYASSSTGDFAANILAYSRVAIQGQGSGMEWVGNVLFDNETNYEGVTPGKGDQYIDPRFVDAESGDLHLRSDSPCIDLIPLEWISPAILDDIDHHKRPVGEGLEPGADEVTDAVIVLPSVFQVAPWRIESGGLSDLFEADENRLLLEAARVRGSNDDLILAIEGIAENPHPLDLRLLFTLAADVPGATYQVEFFNFESQGFEVIRSTPCPLSDTSFEAGEYVKAGRFVEPGTGRVKARLRFRLGGGAPKTGWHVRLDQAVWRLGQP
ncbi:MAG: right-handed parallel beta-helix repeat-containing protein [Fimbriimonadaceae bacterium]|nr:right-handed parallel beta-helix repeat-containing protein [Fimbriimonadaceae bacterium]